MTTGWLYMYAKAMEIFDWVVCIPFSLLLSCVTFANTQNGRGAKQQNIVATFLGETRMWPAKNCYHMLSSGGLTIEL